MASISNVNKLNSYLLESVVFADTNGQVWQTSRIDCGIYTWDSENYLETKKKEKHCSTQGIDTFNSAMTHPAALKYKN